MQSKRGIAGLLLCAVAAGTVSTSWAQALNWGEEYAKRITATQNVSPLGDDVFGDNISLFTGAVSFSATDVSVPGNSALQVALTRMFDTQDVASGDLLADWDLDIPRLEGVHPAGHPWAPAARCSTVAPPPSVENSGYLFEADDFWSGNKMRVGGAGGDLLAITTDPKLVRPTNGVDYKWVTKDGWFLACLPALKRGDGEGFLAYAPDGTRYWFDWMVVKEYPGISQKIPSRLETGIVLRKHVRLYVTRVEDRFGNWVQYEWNGDQLARIHSSDSREIVLTYTNGLLATAASHGRTWRYEYNSNNSALVSVVNPDGSRWTLQHEGPAPLNRIVYREPLDRDDTLHCWPTNDMVDQTGSYTVTHPSGASAKYTFRPMRHGRTNVPYRCIEWGLEDNQVRDRTNDFALTHDAMTLVSKRITGPGIPEALFSYAYSSLEGGYRPKNATDDAITGATPPPHYKYVTITRPDGVEIVNTFGKDFELNEGRLLQVDLRKNGTVLRSTVTTYVSEASLASLPFPSLMGHHLVPKGDNLSAAGLRPVASTVVRQDGTQFRSVAEAFDAQARTTRRLEASTLGYERRRETEYYDDTAAWVMGQVRAERQVHPAPTTELSRTEFDTRHLPWKVYSNGKPVPDQTLEYNSDGTLAKVTDALGKATTLSAWKRGLPQSIVFADNTTRAADVHDAGWINWVRDENGVTTSYGYDAMGRLTRIRYPAESDRTWNETTQSFQPVAVSEYGIPAGHWRQTVQTGDARKITYFDAFWRPLVVESFDAADRAGTLSQTVTRYDANGRKVFESPPINTLSNYSSVTFGTRTAYDGLDRVTSVQQDSELGPLTTTTRYLSGFLRETTNPRGTVVIESFQAFDTPSYDAPVFIDTPLNETTVTRDAFGKPKAMTRSSVD